MAIARTLKKIKSKNDRFCRHATKCFAITLSKNRALKLADNTLSDQNKLKDWDVLDESKTRPCDLN